MIASSPGYAVIVPEEISMMLGDTVGLEVYLGLAVQSLPSKTKINKITITRPRPPPP